MTENQPPRPLLKRGNPVRLLELPKNYSIKNPYLIVGNIYDFMEWNGDEIVITTELKKKYVSIPYTIADYEGIEC